MCINPIFILLAILCLYNSTKKIYTFFSILTLTDISFEVYSESYNYNITHALLLLFAFAN